MTMTDKQLSGVLHRLTRGETPAKEDIRFLLSLDSPDHVASLFDASRTVRQRFFGKSIFLYGFLYFSTHCRNNCRFCRYRRENTGIDRYRKPVEALLRTADEMARTGVHLIDLTMGEDPIFHGAGSSGFTPLLEISRQIQDRTNLPVMISPGVVPETVIKAFAESGVSWFACYQETHSRALFSRLREDQDFDTRLNIKYTARKHGLLVEEGLMTHIGETVDDIADSILWMASFGVDQARAMTFVPQEGTPMAEPAVTDDKRELIAIAVMRLVLQDVLIPASLDVKGLDGLRARLDAGANVITSIVPARNGLAGVANHSLDIDAARRSMDHVLPAVRQCGLVPAGADDYKKWIGKRRYGRHGYTGTPKSLKPAESVRC